jgi:3D (Asp-Asp-Asp) domain-containing protein
MIRYFYLIGLWIACLSLLAPGKAAPSQTTQLSGSTSTSAFAANDDWELPTFVAQDPTTNGGGTVKHAAHHVKKSATAHATSASVAAHDKTAHAAPIAANAKPAAHASTVAASAKPASASATSSTIASSAKPAAKPASGVAATSAPSIVKPTPAAKSASAATVVVMVPSTPVVSSGKPAASVSGAAPVVAVVAKPAAAVAPAVKPASTTVVSLILPVQPNAAAVVAVVKPKTPANKPADAKISALDSATKATSSHATPVAPSAVVKTGSSSQAATPESAESHVTIVALGAAKPGETESSAVTSDKPSLAHTLGHDLASTALAAQRKIASGTHGLVGRLARLTAYWASEGDYYTERHLSATGIHLHGGHCAVDPSIIPYGSVVEIPGFGQFLAVDTGSAVISRAAAREAGHTKAERNALVIDLFFEHRAEGERFAAEAPKFVDVSWWTPSSTSDAAQAARSVFADEQWNKIYSKQL